MLEMALAQPEDLDTVISILEEVAAWARNLCEGFEYYRVGTLLLGG